MKTQLLSLFVYPFIIFLLLINNSCQKQVEISYQDQTTIDQSKDYLRLISDLGFSLENIVEYEDRFVVEGDIALNKLDLLDYSVRTKQARHDYIVSFGNRYSIIVKINDNIGADWRNAFTAAMAEWNSLGGVRMIYQPYSINPDIEISSYIYMSAYANASFPSLSGKPGSTIHVNTSYSLTTSQKKYIATHELGHCLGFRHTDWSDGNEIPGIHIPGTPTGSDFNKDNNSIMNRSKAGTPAEVPNWTGFSYYDKVAYNYMYPSVSLSGPRVIFSSETYSAMNVPLDSTIVWGGLGTNNRTNKTITINRVSNGESQLSTIYFCLQSKPGTILSEKDVLHFVSGYQQDHFGEVHYEFYNDGPIISGGRVWLDTADGIFYGGSNFSCSLSNNWRIDPDMDASWFIDNRYQEATPDGLTIDITYTDNLGGNSYIYIPIEFNQFD